MSHEPAAVRFEHDGLVMAAEFSSVVDVLLPNLWASAAELYEHWRTEERRACSCGGLEDAVVYIPLYRKSWPARACRTCRAVDGPLGLDFEGEEEEPIPDWARTLLGDA